MKKTFIALILLFMATGQIFASCYCNPFRVYVGGVFENKDWRYSTDTLDSHSNHNFWGGVAGFQYLNPCHVYLYAKGQYDSGKRANELTDLLYEREWFAEGHIGYTFPIDYYGFFTITPFIGYGYYHLDQHYYATAIDANERYQYIPGGLFFNYLMDCWSIGWRLQLNLMVSRFYNDGFSETIGTRTFFYSDLPLSYTFCDRWDISLVPFYQWEPGFEYTTITGDTLHWGEITTWGTRLELGVHF